MRLITKRKIDEFTAVHPEAVSSLETWGKAVRLHEWRNWAELRATLPSAELYRSCVIFNVGGSHYRVIGWIRYSRRLKDGRWSVGRIYVRHVLTHAEYDTDKWKVECS